MSTLTTDEALSLLASATDLLNSWAREMAVKEAHDESDIKGVIDRLWNELSTEMSRSVQERALLRQMFKDSRTLTAEESIDSHNFYRNQYRKIVL